MAKEGKFDEFFVACSQETECGLSKNHKHCKLCYKAFDTPYHCDRHFSNSHKSRAVSHGGVAHYPCKLRHGINNKCDRPHYHCPICEKTVTYRDRFKLHLNTHTKSNNKSRNDNKKDNPHVEEKIDEGIAKGDVSSGNETLEEEKHGSHIREEENIKGGKDKKTDKFQKEKEGKKSCPICGKLMHAKSIGRHCRNIHDYQYPDMVTCVDERKGLFLVRHTSKGGVMYPIHVRKILEGEKAGMQCELTECMDFMRVAWRSGITMAECGHLQEVGKGSNYPENLSLSLEALKYLSPDGERRVFAEKKVSECKELQRLAGESNAPLIIPVVDGSRFIHFSVFDGQVNYYSRFGRVIVTADLSNGTLDCRCCRRKVPCKHKRVCLWYFSEKKQLDMFLSGTGIEVKKDETKILNQTESLYPPKDTAVLQKMCRYIHEQKKGTSKCLCGRKSKTCSF